MRSESLAIVTMTWARTRDDEHLLLNSLNRAAMLGLPIVIADRSGRREFVEQLRKLPRTIVVASLEKGLVPQIKAAFACAAAFDADALLYSEPDKTYFFANAAGRLIARALNTKPPALTLSARSNTSFLTFPSTQQYTESVVNHLTSELIGERGDYSYGPFLLPGLLLPHVQGLPADLGWGWRFSIFRAAQRAGIPIVHAIDDLPCPVEQRNEDAAERAHRVRQLSENLRGLID